MKYITREEGSGLVSPTCGTRVGVIPTQRAALKDKIMEKQQCSYFSAPGIVSKISGSDMIYNASIIMQTVEAYLGIIPGAIIEKCRLADYVAARRYAMWFMRVALCMSYTDIGKVTKHDHSTAIWQIRKLENWKTIYPEINEHIHNINNRLGRPVDHNKIDQAVSIDCVK